MRYAVIAVLLTSCIDWSSLYDSRCGDGKIEGTEECDDGNDDDTDACLGNCRWASCGDGYVRAHVEECDDGNREENDACTNTCLSCSAGAENFAFAESGSCFSRFDVPVAWSAAELACDGSMSYLATFVNSHEAMAVEAALLVDVQGPAWIGMRDRSTNGTYAWMSGEPLQWAKWGNGEPAGPAGSCAVTRRDGDNWVWGTLPCERTNAYVCKRTAFSIAPETHHAYLALYAELSWEDAKTACVNRGAHLVTVASAAEQAFVARLTPGEFWIGGRDDQVDGTFTWVTGEAPVYAAFAPGEPDHDAGAQCLLMGVDEGWHDRPCADRNAYVCEIDR